MRGIAAFLQALGDVLAFDWDINRTNYREENVTPVHDYHDQTSNARETVIVTRDDQTDGDNVVGHHLPVIFACGLCVEEKHSMNI